MGFKFPNEPAMPLRVPVSNEDKRPVVRRIRRAKTQEQIEKERDAALDINKEIGKRK